MSNRIKIRLAKLLVILARFEIAWLFLFVGMSFIPSIQALFDAQWISNTGLFYTRIIWILSVDCALIFFTDLAMKRLQSNG